MNAPALEFFGSRWWATVRFRVGSDWYVSIGCGSSEGSAVADANRRAQRVLEGSA